MTARREFLKKLGLGAGVAGMTVLPAAAQAVAEERPARGPKYVFHSPFKKLRVVISADPIKYVQFEDGYFRTRDMEVVGALRLILQQHGRLVVRKNWNHKKQHLDPYQYLENVDIDFAELEPING